MICIHHRAPVAILIVSTWMRCCLSFCTRSHCSCVQHLGEIGRGWRRGNPISPSSSGLCREACRGPAVAERDGCPISLKLSYSVTWFITGGQPPGKCLILKQEERNQGLCLFLKSEEMADGRRGRWDERDADNRSNMPASNRGWCEPSLHNLCKTCHLKHLRQNRSASRCMF